MAAAALSQLDWIAADWGTSALRAWAIAAEGTVLARAESKDGMSGLDARDYEPALLRLVGDWLPDDGSRATPVTVCGMAGARQGWREASYRQVPCPPVSGGELTPVATTDRRLDVSIVPGLCQAEPPDVMRGEETQLAGLLARRGVVDATVCMPGTHCKWARLEKGRVAGFTTFMTGEMFSLLADRSVLRHSVGDGGENRDAFLEGVDEMIGHPERLTAALFGIRAASLVAGLAASAARSRLSGLLVGAELAATRPLWKGKAAHLVGARALSAAYAAALESAGARPVVEDAEALTLAGLAAVRGH